MTYQSHMLRSAFLAIVLLATVEWTVAQDSTMQKSHEFGWVSFGGGIGGPGWGGDVHLSYQRDKLWISARVLGVSEITILGPTPAESVGDIAFMCGWPFSSDHPNGGVSIGISYVKIVRRGRYLGRGSGFFSEDRYEEIKSNTFGLAGDLQVIKPIFPILGVGLSVSGNLNSERSYVALFVTFQMGKLK
ncbi:MAG: hypothetical protein HYR76_09590 [Ignavibacteria bacterium]|nr:hypothetical protein [Ignavibacteria bacterium]